MSEYLLSITIGPVQEFISAARRTRDMWFGSWILSELSKAVARELMVGGGKLIFPFSKTLEDDLKPDSPYAVVNKILAVVKAPDEAAVKLLTVKLKDAAFQRLTTVKNGAVTDALRLSILQGGLDVKTMNEQLEKFTEFYAAWVPFDDGKYEACRADVEKWMAGRKALRDFSPHAGKVGIPKSSLDGVRESVILKGKLKETQFFIRPNEQLDGMGIVKRFGKPKGKRKIFDSTIDVAAGPYIAKLARNWKDGLTRYENYLEQNQDEIPFSYGYLYQHESRGLKELPDLHRTRLGELLKKCNFPEPKPPYYAFFLGDGDGMGTFLSSLKSADSHRDFSERLSRFAGEIQKIADARKDWNLVFAGGDDVMALLPLHEALEAAVAFRRCFQEAMNGLNNPPTFSAGIAIVHALDSLTESWALAKSAENAAKAIDGKDAFAVISSPRSGAEVKVAGKWNQIANEADPNASSLQRFTQLYMNRAISPSFAYALRNLLDMTERRKLKHLDETLFPMAEALAVKKREKQEFIDQLKAAKDRAAVNGKYREELDQLCKLLLVTRPIARAMREARA